jgi:transposase
MEDRHERLRRWTANGTWDRILDEVVVKDDAVSRVEWVLSVDSSSVRAHQAGDNPQAVAVGGPGERAPRVGWDAPEPAPARHRRQGVVASLHPPGATCPPDRVHQPRTQRPDHPPPRAGLRWGRPPAFDQAIYRRRNVVERCFGRLTQFRGLATRYAKRLAYYRAEVVIATISLWLRDSQDTP